MIGIGPEIISTNAGDVRARHLAYAERAGRLTMIVSSFRGDALVPADLGAHLRVYPTNSWNRWTFVADAIRLGTRVATASPIDLLVTQDPFATALAGYLLKRRHRVPLVVGNHSRFLDNPEWIAERPIRHRLFNALAHRMIKKADGLRVVNPAERRQYARAGVPADRVWWLPTPVPLDRFLAAAPADSVAAARRNLAPEGPLLLWVGNPAQVVKDLPTLFGAFEHVRRVHPAAVLALAGDFTRARPADRARASDPASGIRLLGPVPHAELPIYYQAADLYVHSSKYEGLAKVMVEAAASALPIVTTEVPGIEAIVDDGVTGLVAPVGDSGALGEQILDLLRDDHRRRAMGGRARALAIERFSRERQVEAITGMWRAVADRAASEGVR
jgi:glycosyltransferase involved in cell wall biosynthesis